MEDNNKLEVLTQDEYENFKGSDDRFILEKYLSRKGKMMPVILPKKNYSNNTEVLETILQFKKIPQDANACLLSEPLIDNEKNIVVYSIQFYYIAHYLEKNNL